MKKNGFIFIESVTVLIIVVLSLTLMLSSYFLLSRKSKSNEFYDLPKDKYLLYNIGNLGDRDKPYSTTLSFNANKNNCQDYMSQRISDCSQVFEDTNLKNYIIIYNLNEELSSSNVTQKFDSPTIEYLKTLRRCRDKNCADVIKYVVGVFYRNDKYYYASLEL